MHPEGPRRVPEDEIDFARAGRQIARAAGYPFRLLGRHPLILLGFMATAALLAVSTKFLLDRQYKGTFVIRPADKFERFHLVMLADLEALRRQGGSVQLSRLLHVNKEVAASLQAIDYQNPVLQSRRDTINCTFITIKASDPSKLVALQNGILHYLENNPHFSRISTLQREQVRIQREMVEEDLKKLESLKTREAARSPQPASQGILLDELIDPTRVYAMANERMQKKTALMAQEVFMENFQLVKPILVPVKHSFPPRILVVALYFIPASILLCFIFLVFYENVFRGRKSPSP
jgi:hypothetical protein